MKKQRNTAPDELLNEAKRISSRGDLQSAAEQLSRMVEDYPDDISVRFVYSSVLFRLNRYAETVPHLERVLKAQPVNEWASLCLFHSLWKIDRERDAIEEIRRFRDAGGDSMEYRRFFKDLKKLR